MILCTLFFLYNILQINIAKYFFHVYTTLWSWQVIAPEEIVDPNVDEHSVMTYLSQFPKAKLKPGAPLRSKTLHPKRAKAYGPGERHFYFKSRPKFIVFIFCNALSLTLFRHRA